MGDYTKYDIMIVVSIILIIATHTITVYTFSATQQLTKADYESIVKVKEANPVAGLIMQMKNLRFIFTYVLIPAFVWASYWAVRRKKDIHYISFTANFFLMVAILNILNDFPYLLGLMRF